MPGEVTLTLRIENHYRDGGIVVTTPTVTVPVPPDPSDVDAWGEWEYDHIFQATGTGREGGDASYFVEVTESSLPELLGREFEFGV